MALEERQMWALVGVLAILLLVLLYTNRMAKQGPTMPRGADDGEEERDAEPFLLKFVHHGGDVVGETVAVDGDWLVLKQAGVFKSVPVDQAEVAGEEVVLHGEVDWDAAIERGQAWRDQKTAGAHPEVSEELTRSEDVRDPALEALQKRKAEREARPAVPLESDDSEE